MSGECSISGLHPLRDKVLNPPLVFMSIGMHVIGLSGLSLPRQIVPVRRAVDLGPTPVSESSRV